MANSHFGLIFFQTETDTGNCSMEPSLDDREVVVQPGRSAEKMSMIQKFIEETSLPFAKACQIVDASVQIPHGASIAKNLEDSVTEDQQARARRYVARLRYEINTGKHTHYRTGGGKTERSRLAAKQDNGRGMTTAAPSHRPARALVNTIPDREKSIAVVFALEGVIKFSQHLIRMPHIGTS